MCRGGEASADAKITMRKEKRRAEVRADVKTSVPRPCREEGGSVKRRRVVPRSVPRLARGYRGQLKSKAKRSEEMKCAEVSAGGDHLGTDVIFSARQSTRRRLGFFRAILGISHIFPYPYKYHLMFIISEMSRI